MNRLPLRLTWITLVFDALGFLFFLIYSFYGFSTEIYEMSFRGSWVFQNAVLLFCRSLLALHCAAAVTTYSLFHRTRQAPRTYQDPTGPFYKLVVFSLIVFLVSTLAGFLLNELAVPKALAVQYAQREETRISRTLYERAEEAESRGDYAEARTLFRRYMELNPGTREELQARQERLEKSMEEMSPVTSAGPDSPAALQNLSPRELLDLARRYDREEDYFSGYYYSSLAFQVDDQFTEAREFASRMWSKIESAAPLKEEVFRTDVFNIKKKGTTQLSSGKPVEAYYTFLELKDKIAREGLPADPDVEVYLAMARTAAEDVVFLASDAEDCASTPGYTGLFFRNPLPEGSGASELIRFGRAVPHLPQQGSWMVEDVAVIRWDQRGVLYSLTAPYGKVLFPPGGGSAQEGAGGELILKGIDSGSRESRFLPLYEEKRQPPALTEMIPLGVSPNQLAALAEERTGYEMTSLMWLWDSRKLTASLGIDPRPLERRILEKLFYPFSFLILCLFALTFGWILRHRSGPPAPASYILLPLLPFLFYRITQFYSAGFTTVLQYMLTLTGFPGALAFLLVSQALLLILAFVLLAGQSNR